MLLIRGSAKSLGVLMGLLIGVSSSAKQDPCDSSLYRALPTHLSNEVFESRFGSFFLSMSPFVAASARAFLKTRFVEGRPSSAQALIQGAFSPHRSLDDQLRSLSHLTEITRSISLRVQDPSAIIIATLGLWIKSLGWSFPFEEPLDDALIPLRRLQQIVRNRFQRSWEYSSQIELALRQVRSLLNPETSPEPTPLILNFLTQAREEWAAGLQVGTRRDYPEVERHLLWLVRNLKYQQQSQWRTLFNPLISIVATFHSRRNGPLPSRAVETLESLSIDFSTDSFLEQILRRFQQIVAIDLAQRNRSLESIRIELDRLGEELAAYQGWY